MTITQTTLASESNLACEPKTLGFLLSDTTRLMRRLFAKRLENHELTLAELKALIFIARYPGIRQVDLADMLDIQPITLARLVDQLCETDFVERRPHPNDRRAFQLFVTAKAEPSIEMFKREAAIFQTQAAQGLSEEQIETLFFCLTKIHTNISNLL